jgi:hypothetical protein
VKQVIVRNLQTLALAVIVGIATIVIALGSLSVSEVARKVNEYEGQHRTGMLNEGQHRFA